MQIKNYDNHAVNNKSNFNFRALHLDDAFFEKITELDWKKQSLKPESQNIKVQNSL